MTNLENEHFFMLTSKLFFRDKSFQGNKPGAVEYSCFDILSIFLFSHDSFQVAVT